MTELSNRLFKAVISKRVNTTVGNEAISLSDAAKLLTLASLISLGEDDSINDRMPTRDDAYDICVGVLELFPDNIAFARAVFYILARLGNFPGVQLLSQRSKLLDTIGHFRPIEMEAVARMTENEMTIAPETVVTFTDFQCRLYDLLSVHRTISFSAPTSAGKSFILSLDVVRKLNATPEAVVVYIVPTRALIRQVSMDLALAFSQYCIEDFTILTAPILPPDNAAPKGTVYVLTQERYMTFLFPPIGNPSVDYLYVDEAHEIRKRDRGMTLHSVLNATRQKFPKAKIVFSSPLTKNPDFFFDEFPQRIDGQHWVEHSSPVSQNLIFLSPVAREKNAVEVVLFKQGERIHVGKTTLPFVFRDKTLRLAYTAHHFTRTDETSIIFSNEPKEAQTLAFHIAEKMGADVPDIAERIKPLVEFIREHVHPEYLLLKILPRGVAYHYGDMPSLVRTQIEDLVRENVIRFVCCTSTLLQGVNLPAKNIFIQTPRETRGVPLSTTDFWNLAGRAGRLRRNFSGNVWCLDVKEWANNPENGERLTEIRSAFRDTLLEQSSEVLAIATNRNLPTSGSPTEQAFAKIYAEYTLAGQSIADTNYAKERNLVDLKAIDAVCLQIREEIHTPREILEKNSAISPWCLERLYQTFVNAPDITAYIPMHPLQGGADSLRKAFKTIDECLLGLANDSWKFHGWIATSWMLGEPLIDIFKKRIGFLQNTKPQEWIDVDVQDKTNDIIREVMQTLERTIHFTYVKYTRAYIDLLIVALHARGLPNEAKRIPTLHIYLEFGTCDEMVLSLVSFGLSRTTAILIQRGLGRHWPPAGSKAELRARLATTRYAEHLPKLCVKEIRELIFAERAAN